MKRLHVLVFACAAVVSAAATTIHFWNIQPVTVPAPPIAVESLGDAIHREILQDIRNGVIAPAGITDNGTC